jgi:hypothetical protein
MTDEGTMRAAESESRHPDEATFERLMLGELSPFERRAALRHVERCAECSRVHAALAELESGARAFDPGVPAHGTGRRIPGPWIGLAAAAALALAVVLPWRSWMGDSTQPESDSLRTLESSTGPRLVSPLGTVAAVERFVWTPVPGAASYQLELYDGEAEPLWTSPALDQPGVAWPPAVPARPGLYYWRVEAAVGGGAETVTSPLERFALNGPGGGSG